MPTALLTRLLDLRDRLGQDPERGDVPGWVLITIMSAGLVTVIWGVADDQLTTLLGDALDAVRAP